MNKLTQEKVIEKYGDIPCKFSSYYKYTFTFSSENTDGYYISLSCGGDSSEIYKYEVTRNTIETINDENYNSCIVYYDGEIVCEFENPNNWW